MSLFGTGRREGVIAVLLLGGIVIAAHLIGTWLQYRGVAAGIGDWPDRDQSGLCAAMRSAGAAVRSGDLPLWNGPVNGPGEPLWHSGAPLLYPLWWLLAIGGPYWTQLLAALHAAIACTTSYRFLRALGRSRFAAFLGGGAYGLNSWLLAAMATLPQAAAAAWLPLQLEAVLRTVTPGRYRQGTVLLCVALALPFATGGTILATIGLLASLLILFGSQHRILSHERPHVRARTGLALLLAALLTAPEWLAFAELGAVPSHYQAPRMSALWTSAQPLAWLSQLGCLALVLLPLALLRPQRQVRGWPWLLAALGGGAMTALVAARTLVLDLPAPLPDALWNSCLWLCTTGVLVLATAGLDDFLGMPQKRPWSLWGVPLLLLAGLGGLGLARPDLLVHLRHATGLAFGLGAAVLAAVLLPCWRPLGILRWKQAFAVVVLAAAVGPVLFLDLQPRRPEAGDLPPMPAGELPLLLFSDIAPKLRFDCVASRDALHPELQVVERLPTGFRGKAAPTAHFTAERPRGSSRRYEVDMADGRGLLVVGDVLGPGWHAALDGAPVPILWTDLTTGAVAVPEGRHVVVCEFRPLLWRLGLPLALLGMLGTSLWILSVLCHRRRPLTAGAAVRKPKP